MLKPSSRLNKLVVGILGRAKQMFEVRVYALVFLSNHYHLVLAAKTPLELSRFMAFVNGNIAREAGRLHDWSGPFWHRRYRAIPILDEVSLLARVHYVLRNGVKEGLVAHPANWPGVQSVRALTHAKALEGIWIDRTSMYLASRTRRKVTEKAYTTRVKLELEPLPGWEGLSEAERGRAAQALVDDAAESEQGDERGDLDLLRQDPHDRPSSPAKSPAPLCHGSTGAQRIEFRERYRTFVDAYRTAMEGLRARLGELGFPTHGQVIAFMSCQPA